MSLDDKTMPDAKWLKKRAFALYKKHVTGRGYVWPVGCSMPDDVQAAVVEGMREAYAAAQPEHLQARIAELQDQIRDHHETNITLVNDACKLSERVAELEAAQPAIARAALEMAIAAIPDGATCYRQHVEAAIRALDAASIVLQKAIVEADDVPNRII